MPGEWAAIPAGDFAGALEARLHQSQVAACPIGAPMEGCAEAFGLSGTSLGGALTIQRCSLAARLRCPPDMALGVPDKALGAAVEHGIGVLHAGGEEATESFVGGGFQPLLASPD